MISAQPSSVPPSSSSTAASTEFLISAVAGALSSAVVKSGAAPLERVKLLLQTQNINAQMKLAGKRYSGVFDCVTQVYRTQGIISFWRGNVAALARNLPNQSLSFAFRDALKPFLVPSNPDPTSYRYLLFIIGNLASGWGALYCVVVTYQHSIYIILFHIISGRAGGMTQTLLYPLDLARTK